MGVGKVNDRPMRKQTPPAKRLNAVKLGFVVLVATYGILCAASPSTYRFLDRVDLAVHLVSDMIGRSRFIPLRPMGTPQDSDTGCRVWRLTKSIRRS